MPHQTGPALDDGVREAQEMFSAIQRCNRESIESHGDLDVPAVAEIILQHCRGAIFPRSFLLACAEVWALAMEAGVIGDPSTWEPIHQRKPEPEKRLQG